MSFQHKTIGLVIAAVCSLVMDSATISKAEVIRQPFQPSQATGALFSSETTELPSGSHMCTGVVLDTPKHNQVMTAAHCMNDMGNYTFSPGYNKGQNPYGVWKVKSYTVPKAWSQNSDPNSDFAVLTLEPQNGVNIGNLIQGASIADSPKTSTPITVTGYNEGKNDVAVFCKTTSYVNNNRLSFDCPHFDIGTSGSPWLYFNKTGSASLIGVIGGPLEGGNDPKTSYSSWLSKTTISGLL